MRNLFKQNTKRGMTYIELIVVLSIFSIITGTVIFNYQSFQNKVDLKNLANDVALKVVEAQKNSTAGELPFGKTIYDSPPLDDPWKPSYGIYFNPGDISGNTGPKVFYYFTDLDQNKKFDEVFNCPLSECIEKFQITKAYSIESAVLHYYGGSTLDVSSGISLTYTRPDSTMTLRRSSDSVPLSGVDYIQFILSSEDEDIEVSVNVYSSGRIEII